MHLTLRCHNHADAGLHAGKAMHAPTEPDSTSCEHILCHSPVPGSQAQSMPAGQDSYTHNWQAASPGVRAPYCNKPCQACCWRLRQAGIGCLSACCRQSLHSAQGSWTLSNSDGCPLLASGLTCGRPAVCIPCSGSSLQWQAVASTERQLKRSFGPLGTCSLAW